MAAHRPPDPRILFFIERYVTTLDDIECPVLLIQTPERWWDAESICRELHVQVGYARHVLANALQLEISSRFESPKRSAISINREMMNCVAAADAFAEGARTNRLEMMRLVTERASRNIRDFAKAFRIRRDNDS